MKFTVPKSSFAQALTSIQSIVKNNSTLPVLSHVLIKAEGGRIVISATDLDSLVIQNCAAEVADEGGLTLPAKKLLDIIRSLDAQEVTLAADETKATIKAGKASFNLMGSDAGAFPPFDSLGDETGSFSIGNKKLLQLISESSFCAGQDESRPALQNICVQVDNSSINFVATDGKRIVHVLTDNSSKKAIQSSILLPVHKTKDLAKFFNLDGETTVSLLSSFVRFNVNDGQTIILMRLPELSYPAWQNIFPKSFGAKVDVSREDFLAILKRAAIIVPEKAQAVKFTWSKNNLNVVARSIEVGDLTEDLEVKYRGESFEIAFDPRYLIDALQVIDSQDVSLHFTNGMSPMMIESGDFKYVLMPMRLT